MRHPLSTLSWLMRSAALLATLGALAAAPGPSRAQDEELVPVSFGTNWLPQAEHGGFYQALATGLYEEFGLDVTIRPGGPQVDHRTPLVAGKLDFYMGGNLFGQFTFTEAGAPVVTVAALFQKEPQALLAHPDAGITSFEDIDAEHTLYISKFGMLFVWPWLESAFGYEREQVEPYTYSLAPFLSDPMSVQQGYVTSEPFAVREQGGFEPVVLLMADAGYDTYSTMIQATETTIQERPEVVQSFVDASIIGWYDYLYGDPTPANDLIKAANPEMTDEQIAFSIEAMKEHGIVDSGKALEQGIGAMSDERWHDFYEKSVKWGSFPPGLAIDEAYTLDFVNEGVGLELKDELQGG